MFINDVHRIMGFLTHLTLPLLLQMDYQTSPDFWFGPLWTWAYTKRGSKLNLWKNFGNWRVLDPFGSPGFTYGPIYASSSLKFRHHLWTTSNFSSVSEFLASLLPVYRIHLVKTCIKTLFSRLSATSLYLNDAFKCKILLPMWNIFIARLVLKANFMLNLILLNF